MSARPAHSFDNNFNFLRLLFATAVICAHSQQIPYGTEDLELLHKIFGGPGLGEFALYGFFALSGYLITQSYFRTPRPLAFLTKRVARIYPGFVVCCLLCAFVLAPLLFGWSQYFAAFPVGPFFRDLVILHFRGPKIVFTQWNFNWSINGPLWTISYEFLCYLSVLILGHLRVLQSRAMMLTLFALWTAVRCSLPWTMPLLGHVTLADYFEPGPAINLSQYFLCGSCAFVFKDALKLSAKGATLAVVAVGTLLCIPGVGAWAMAVPFTYLLLYVAFWKIPALTFFQRVSDISYGTYLYGWPIGIVLFYQYPSITPVVHFVINLPLAYLMGYLSWNLLEKPCLILAHR